jgi:hypothetical protein
VSRSLGINPGSLAEGIPDLVASGQGARERAADADTDFPSCLLTEPGIEGHQFQDIDRLKLQTVCDPIHTAVIDETEVVLPEMEERKGSTPLGDGVVSHRLVNLGKEVRRNQFSLFGTVRRSCMSMHEDF